MTSLRVLVVTPDGPRGRGGIDRMMVSFARELRQSATPGLDVAFIRSRGTVRLLSPVVFGIAAVRIALAAVLRRADIVHLNMALGGSTLRKGILAFVADALGLPFVIHLHSGHFDEYWRSRRRVARWFIDCIFSRASAVVVLGDIWAEVVRNNLPGIRCPIIVVRNAVPDSYARHENASSQDVHVVFLGRLGPEKGTPELLAALGKVADVPAWRATLAGDGGIATARATADTYRIRARVAFPGWLDDTQVDSLLRDAGILVLPSKAENLPMSIIEAFSYGVPVIATPVGAIPEIVQNGVSGLLVPVGDTDALAAALRRLITDSDLRRKLGNGARQRQRSELSISNYTHELTAAWRLALSHRYAATSLS
ncbi:MAG TPA: glycosyltransferase family 4 protein [Devosia sp.]|nr:glycosyltransferase family 4 protein [Devosia sp.]